MNEGGDNWRVKNICAFTRSIGDCMMKRPNAAYWFNNCCPGARIQPRCVWRHLLQGVTGKHTVV